MNSSKEIKLVEIFAGSLLDAEMLKSLLQDAEIESYLKDEFVGSIAPWQASAGGTGSVKIVISNLDYDKAKQVTVDFINNLNTK